MKKIKTKIKSPTLIGIVLISSILFVLQITVWGGNTPAALCQQGAIYAPFTKGVGICRVISSLFLHGNYTALFINMVCLCAIGKHLEHKIGHFWTLGLFLIGGIFGNIVTIITEYSWKDIKTAGVFLGASPAIFAFIGATLVLRSLRPEDFPLLRAWKLVIITIIALLPLFFVAYCSIMGCIGGTIGGIVFGYTWGQITQKRTKKDAQKEQNMGKHSQEN